MDVGTGQDDGGPIDGDAAPTVEGSRVAPPPGEGADAVDLTGVTAAGPHDAEDPMVIDLRDGVDTVAAYEADQARRAADTSRDRR